MLLGEPLASASGSGVCFDHSGLKPYPLAIELTDGYDTSCKVLAIFFQKSATGVEHSIGFPSIANDNGDLCIRGFQKAAPQGKSYRIIFRNRRLYH